MPPNTEDDMDKTTGQSKPVKKRVRISFKMEHSFVAELSADHPDDLDAITEEEVIRQYYFFKANPELGELESWTEPVGENTSPDIHYPPK